MRDRSSSPNYLKIKNNERKNFKILKEKNEDQNLIQKKEL